MKSAKPKIFVVSGPGGVGKTTLVNKILRRKAIKRKFIKSISVTTRPRRPGEKDGRDYYFISKEKFLKLKKANFFLEAKKVLEYYYGTPKSAHDKAKRQGKDLILCIDVKGAVYLKRKRGLGRIISIFIDAPSNVLRKRLLKRDETKKLIKKRLQLAKKEMLYSCYYDYVIPNRDIKSSSNHLEKILLKEYDRR